MLCHVQWAILYNTIQQYIILPPFLRAQVHTPKRQSIDGAEQFCVKELLKVPTQWWVLLRPKLSALQTERCSHHAMLLTI